MRIPSSENGKKIPLHSIGWKERVFACKVSSDPETWINLDRILCFVFFLFFLCLSFSLFFGLLLYMLVFFFPFRLNSLVFFFHFRLERWWKTWERRKKNRPTYGSLKFRFSISIIRNNKLKTPWKNNVTPCGFKKK